MKNLFALLPLFALLFTSPELAQAKGGDMGNAGDLVVREFSLTAQDIYNRLKLLPDSELSGIDMNRLQGAILNVEIISRETLVNPVNDNEVPALNYPEKNLLIINRRMWAPLRLKEQTESRYALVLHEFLYLVGIDDQEFHKSNHLIEMLGVKEFNSGRIWNPLNPVNRISTSLVFNPGACVLKGLDFDTQVQEEDKQEATTGDCGEAFRRVSVKKASFQAPPSSGWKGLFHRFEITVSDGAGKELGQVTVEPEWGKCLLPQDGGCAVGGKFFIGGVEFKFWFNR